MNKNDIDIVLNAIRKKKYEDEETSLSPKALEIKTLIDMMKFKEEQEERFKTTQKEHKE